MTKASSTWQAPEAKLNWSNSNTPVATDFDDVYFSKDDCMGEVDHVFIEGNQLRQRFQTNSYSKSHANKHHFIIAETGFGTGLNFLLTLQLWLASPISRDKQLHFISVEQFPISRSELAKAHTLWPELAELAHTLQLHYPPTLQGMHYRELDLCDSYPNSLPIKLSLLFNEAQLGFSQLHSTTHISEIALPTEGVDAWFLDGFSPSKNPEMWQDNLFHLMARLSFNQSDDAYTSLATFTAAGFVRRGLKQVGFSMSKRKGFGRKRDMLVGKFKGVPTSTAPLKASTRKQAYGDFWPIFRPNFTLRSHQQSVAIIGAGISGLTTAASLAKAGFKVDVFESRDDAMQEASGNPQAVLFPKLSPHRTPFSEFNLLSLNFAVSHYLQLNQQQPVFTQCGLLQCEAKETKAQLQELAQCFSPLMQFVSAKQASDISQTQIKDDALYYPDLGFVDTQALKELLLKQSGIKFHPNCTVLSIKKTELDSSKWVIDFNETPSTQSDFVVICNANAAQQLLPNNNMSLKNIRGQITQVSRDNTAPHFPDLKTTVCHKGYINPSVNKSGESTLSFGATFDLHKHTSQGDEASDNYNLSQLKNYLPDFSSLKPKPANDNETWQSRVNFRCTANDYMPVVGPLNNTDLDNSDFDFYRKNAHAHIPTPLACHEGLFINIGYGSRGFTTAPISAEVIKSYLTASIQPLPKALIKAIHPGRFYIKHCKQAKPK